MSGERDVVSDIRNIAKQVRTHRTYETQNIQRLHQDTIPADQMQDPFLLMLFTSLLTPK